MDIELLVLRKLKQHLDLAVPEPQKMEDLNFEPPKDCNQSTMKGYDCDQVEGSASETLTENILSISFPK